MLKKAVKNIHKYSKIYLNGPLSCTEIELGTGCFWMKGISFFRAKMRRPLSHITCEPVKKEG